ncbi:anti-sigma factor [Paenibacillus wulumuqiensis]|uniref:anti-sigma factor n=1 Tax=Paenibacillus wulumuqiensis TaxID=1567107 RepID=UPI0006199ACE|nr:zf-HC2 domain-containing protein [Paenibacillus wulumuqiensis]
MNCREAEELFGIYWDLTPDDPRRLALDEHVRECPDCAAEFEVWKESHELIQAETAQLEDMPTMTIRAENINRNVMDRIYAESPWLVQTDVKRGPISRLFRRRLSVWISSLIAVFICSSIYLTLDMTGTFEQQPQPERVIGIVPTAVATGDDSTVVYSSLHFAGSERGLIDPLVIPMNPSHPQYWMILSLVGMLLALVSLRWLARTKHQ